MSRAPRPVRSTALLLLSLACLGSAVHALDSSAPKKPVGPARRLEIPAAEAPIKLPDGPSRAGWEAYTKNDFAGAVTAFNKALEAEPQNLLLLEGLRASLVAQGKYKDVQAVNLRMVLASAQEPINAIFVLRTIDAMPFVAGRDEVVKTFKEAAAKAAPSVAGGIRDQIASLLFRANQFEEARKELAGLGYVDRWIFAAGPFGVGDQNNPLERRFAPERALKSLEFRDEPADRAGADGEKVAVHKDITVSDRDLNLATLFQGANGIFYAFTNIESDIDQDVRLFFSVAQPYRVFLRGMPILQEPHDERIQRQGGAVARVRLAKGANPILVKMGSASSLIVRVTGEDFAPLANTRVAPLAPEALAAHEASTARGILLSERGTGSTANFFMQRLPAAERKVDTALLKLSDLPDLNIAEAFWLDLAGQREGDATARAILARRLMGSFPDSVGVLDIGAAILKASGSTLGNTDGREGEEARQIRERALEILPTSHQHLIAMYDFLRTRNLLDQAYDRIKACAEAHPQSGAAQSELSEVFELKQFIVEAERAMEKAAEIDAAFLPKLVAFHERVGNRVRARELRTKARELNVGPEPTAEDLIRRGELDAAEKLIALQEKWRPDLRSTLAFTRVWLLAEKGQMEEAFALQKKLYAELSKHANKRPHVVYMTDLALRLGRDDEAKGFLSAYLKEKPGDFELRRRLSGLQGESSRWWETYDVKVSEIDTSRFTNANYPSSNHAWIVDFMVTKVMPDLSRESYVHIAQKVLNLQGINELSEVLVRAQQQDLVFVRTLNPDGSSYQPQNMHDFNLAQSASLYKVGPGSILEHAYLEHKDAEEDDLFFNMGFNFNAIDAPRAVSRWVVMIADEAKPKLNIRKIRPEMIEEKIYPGPAGFTVYEWKNKQVEGIKEEPFMPGDADYEVIPMVFVESQDKLFRANRWLMRRENALIPSEAEAQAQAIKDLVKKKGGNEADMFHAILGWVRQGITEGGDSKTMQDVWFSRAGNLGQATVLAREMCHAAGLKVRSAFVNGGYNPEKIFRSKNSKYFWSPAELGTFGNAGHMLVLERSDDADEWAQFTGSPARFYGMKDLNNRQAGQLAITFGDDGARMKRVWGETLGQTNVTHRVDVFLDDKGNSLVNGQLLLHGQLGGSLREAMSDPKKNQRVKEYMVKHSWPKMKIAKVQALNEEVPDRSLGLEYSGVVADLAGRAEKALFLRPFLGTPTILKLQGPPARQSDMLIKEEVADLDHTITYFAPEGHAWVEIPDDLFICTEYGFFMADYNVRGRKLTCTASYLMPAQRITPEKYPEVLDFLRQVTANQQQRIGYAPLNQASFGEWETAVFSAGYASAGQEKAKKDK